MNVENSGGMWAAFDATAKINAKDRKIRNLDIFWRPTLTQH